MRLSGINKTFKGFTIIEILIAIIIIGILVAIIIPRLATRADLARRRAAESGGPMTGRRGAG
ncbi:MAG TPA: prepilin-type N-terminal cleavage/methylation domain-containing protein, partial [Candidatus Sumerlaeota bacterium]|nr:prepilin-type N-terminal cleavage/methylation domain-containing protein [Candidatus Sumerlaeota bacterium]